MRILVAAILALVCAAIVSAQPVLTPQTQADVLIYRITASMEAGNAKEALDGLTEFRRLGVKMPPALLFMEGRLAAIAKDYSRSKKALNEYLALPEVRSDNNYPTALSLFEEVGTATIASRASACSLITSRNKITASNGDLCGFRDADFSPQMTIVSGGEFVMGSPSHEEGRRAPEGPQHKVSISNFAIGKYEVTFSEWDRCAQEKKCRLIPRYPGATDRHPVLPVSWDDAASYVKWLGEVTGKNYRLPSESEWEFVAREGSSEPYVIGPRFDESHPHLVMKGAEAVGSYPANDLGLHDIHTNAVEWTQDCRHGDYVGAPADGTSWTSGDCSFRVIRGGPYMSDARIARSAQRGAASATDQGDLWGWQGFRVARELTDD